MEEKLIFLIRKRHWNFQINVMILKIGLKKEFNEDYNLTEIETALENIYYSDAYEQQLKSESYDRISPRLFEIIK